MRGKYESEAFQQVKREVGDVSILVNNAGMVTGKYTFVEAPDSLVDRTLRVNVAAHFWVKKKNSFGLHSLYLCFYVMRTVSLLLSQIFEFTDLQGVSPSYAATEPWAPGLCGMPWSVVCNEWPCRYNYWGILEIIAWHQIMNVQCLKFSVKLRCVLKIEWDFPTRFVHRLLRKQVCSSELRRIYCTGAACP